MCQREQARSQQQHAVLLHRIGEQEETFSERSASRKARHALQLRELEGVQAERAERAAAAAAAAAEIKADGLRREAAAARGQLEGALEGQQELLARLMAQEQALRGAQGQVRRGEGMGRG